MDIVKLIKQKSEADQNQTVLVVSERTSQQSLEETLKTLTPKPNLTLDEEFDSKDNVNDTVFLQVPESKITDSLLQKILKSCKPGSQLVITKIAKNADNVEFLLKTNGFTNVEATQTASETQVVARKPKYDVGSASKLNLKKPAAAVWKLDDDDGDEETIDPDNLLDEDDLKKPDPSSLRVCGTTGKRKACKDCSCGLADELAGEAKNGDVVDTTNAPKSSCGSCYLGDAFRCGTCPYLGMPAFKPGEKIQLSDNLLQADI